MNRSRLTKRRTKRKMNASRPIATNLFAPLQRRRDAEELIDVRLRSRQALTRDIVNLFQAWRIQDIWGRQDMKTTQDLPKIGHDEGSRSQFAFWKSGTQLRCFSSTHRPPPLTYLPPTITPFWHPVRPKGDPLVWASPTPSVHLSARSGP